jgi:hypothetical protein
MKVEASVLLKFQASSLSEAGAVLDDVLGRERGGRRGRAGYRDNAAGRRLGQPAGGAQRGRVPAGRAPTAQYRWGVASAPTSAARHEPPALSQHDSPAQAGSGVPHPALPATRQSRSPESGSLGALDVERADVRHSASSPSGLPQSRPTKRA